MAFLGLIAVATVNTFEDATTGRSSAPRTSRSGAARRSSPCPTSAALDLATRTSPRTTADHRSNPCDDRAHAGLPDRPAGGDPRLRPLRQAAGDLVLVHRGADCLPTQDVVDRCRAPLRGAGSTSSRSTCATTATTRARHRRASTAGPFRSATTLTAPSRTSTGSAVCPTVAFAYPGGDLRRGQARRPRTRPSGADAGRRQARRRLRGSGRERPELVSDAPIHGGRSRRAREEFPGLVAALRRSSSAGSGRCTRALQASGCACCRDRFSGAQAINLRNQPIPWAYRVFYRHIGLDPDEQRTPVEELALERMKAGGFKSKNRLDDALTIAIDRVGRRGPRASTPTGSTGPPQIRHERRRGRSSRGGPASCRREPS